MSVVVSRDGIHHIGEEQDPPPLNRVILFLIVAMCISMWLIYLLYQAIMTTLHKYSTSKWSSGSTGGENPAPDPHVKSNEDNQVPASIIHL